MAVSRRAAITRAAALNDRLRLRGRARARRTDSWQRRRADQQSRRRPPSPRQSENALRDDVALHFGGAGIDGGGARPQQFVHPEALIDGARLALGDEADRPEDFDRGVLQPLLELAPENLE